MAGSSTRSTVRFRNSVVAAGGGTQCPPAGSMLDASVSPFKPCMRGTEGAAVESSSECARVLGAVRALRHVVRVRRAAWLDAAKRRMKTTRPAEVSELETTVKQIVDRCNAIVANLEAHMVRVLFAAARWAGAAARCGGRAGALEAVGGAVPEPESGAGPRIFAVRHVQQDVPERGVCAQAHHREARRHHVCQEPHCAQQQLARARAVVRRGCHHKPLLPCRTLRVSLRRCFWRTLTRARSSSLTTTTPCPGCSMRRPRRRRRREPTAGTPSGAVVTRCRRHVRVHRRQDRGGRLLRRSAWTAARAAGFRHKGARAAGAAECCCHWGELAPHCRASGRYYKRHPDARGFTRSDQLGRIDYGKDIQDYSEV